MGEQLRMTTFTQWLYEQDYREDSVGNLANLVEMDADWPTGGRRLRTFREYINDFGVDGVRGDALAALEKAWAEWRVVRMKLKVARKVAQVNAAVRRQA